MAVETDSPRARWVSAFFQPPNKIDPNTDEISRAWIPRILAGDRSFVAPCAYFGKYVLVCVGLDMAATRDLREELQAFIGASHSLRFETTDAPATDVQELEQLLRLEPDDRLPDQARAFRVELQPDDRPAAVQLTRLAGLRSRQPALTENARLPIAYLIRDFEGALGRGEISRARAILRHISNTGLLGVQNLTGLELLCMARERRWNDMLQLEDIADLVRLRLPRDVVGALTHAVFFCHVEPHLDAAPAELVAAFKAEVLCAEDLGPLFREPKWAKTGPEILTWTLLAATQDPPDIRLARDLGDIPVDTEPLEQARRRLLAHLEAGPETHEARTPSQLLMDGNYASAWDALEHDEALSDEDRAWLSIICAEALRDPVVIAKALDRADSLPVESQERLHRDPLLDRLTQGLRLLTRADGVAIDCWQPWFDALLTSENVGHLGEVARDHARDWNACALLNNHTTGETLLEIATGRPERASVLEEVIPVLAPALLSCWDTETARTRNANSVLLSLLQVISSVEGLGQFDLAILLETATRLLNDGLTAADYRELIDLVLAPSWQRVASSHYAPWLNDVLQVISESPCHDVDARQRFIALAQQSLAPRSHTLKPEVAEALAETLSALGAPTPFLLASAGQNENADWAALAERSVLIYSLREEPTHRAREWLLQRQPGATISTWAETHPTTRMTAAAAGADVLVIVTGAATHAATEALEAARSHDSVVRYPIGTGWAGIVQCVRDGLAALSA